VSAGYGLTPFGEGDWGSENTIIPGTGSVTTSTAGELVLGTVTMVGVKQT
jgi:hypothetical protein